MKRRLNKNKVKKNLLKLLTVALVFMYACSGTGWHKSPAKDDYKIAKDQYKEGKKIESLVSITKAVIADPVQPKPKDFINDHYKDVMSKTLAEINAAKGTKDIAKAERAYYLYGVLINLNNNIKQIKFPLKHPKGKWTFTTEYVDYTKQKGESRVYTYNLINQYAKNLLAQNKVDDAYNQYTKAFNKYTLTGEKVEKGTDIYNDLLNYAKEKHQTEDVKLVMNSNSAYAYALKYNANSTEAKEGVEATKIKASNLWVIEGQKEEKKNTLQSLQTAYTYYENSLKWNSKNAEAPKLKEGVKPKIAEIYYQQGLAAEKEATRDFEKIKNIYAEATKWVPAYKDVAKRLNVFSILFEIQDVQKNIAVTEAEHGKLTGRVTSVTNGVTSTQDMLNKITYVSDKLRGLNDGMKLTSKILKALGPIPFIGTACKGTSMTITTARTPIQSAVTFFNNVEKPIITPTKEAVDKAKVKVDAVKTEMDKTQAFLKHTKQTLATAESCLWKYEKEDEFKEYAAALKGINSTLSPINKVLVEINKGLTEVENKVNSVKQIAAGFAPNMEANIKAFEPIINSISDATKSIEKVLKKEKWGLSAEKILNGVSGVMDFMTGWAEDLVKPYIDKLAAQIPPIPGLEEMKAEIDKFKAAFAEVNKAYDKLNAQYEKYTNYEKIIAKNLNKIRGGCMEGTAFFIQSVQEYGKSNKGFLDVPSNDPIYEQGQNIQVWDLGDKSNDRLFYIEDIGNGYVKISPAHAVTIGYLDVSGNNSADGTNIHLWDNNNSNAQKFKLKKLGNNKYKIVNANGKVLCLANRSSENGSNVHIWSDHKGAFTEWVFIDPSTNKAVDPLKK